MRNSAGFATDAVALFQQEPGLGPVFPPMIHIVFPKVGRGWYANRAPATELTEEVAGRAPFDEVPPLTPYGCISVARPPALQITTEHEWAYEQYAPPTKHWDGSLAHVQEWLIAAAELGHLTRAIMTSEHGSISHTALDFKLDHLGATLPGYAVDQIRFLYRAGWLEHGGVVALNRVWPKLHHPRVTRALRPLDRPMRIAHRCLSRVAHTGQWRTERREVHGGLTKGELRPEE